MFTMTAFFIIPFSLTSTELIIILLVALLMYLNRKFPGFFMNLGKALRNFIDEQKDK